MKENMSSFRNLIDPRKFLSRQIDGVIYLCSYLLLRNIIGNDE